MADEGYRFLAIPIGDAQDYVLDKDKSISEFATYFLMRVMKMFKYKGLPEEIPVDCLNKMLLQDGFCWFTKWNGATLTGEKADQYYVFHGRMGSVIDAYYRPTEIIIANPGANCFENFTLGKQKDGTYYGEKGVIIRNDTLYHGLMPLIKRYAYLLAENLLTLRSADVFLRIIALISGQDDKTLISANEFIKSIEKGEMKAVAEGKFFEGVKMQSPPNNNGSYLTQFIEYQQYFLGSFFNEIGLNANFNMKRESIAKSESSLNEDSMLPLCQNMLMCRQEDFRVVNEMYGLNIEVEFDSAWLQNALEIVMQLKAMNGGGAASGIATGGFNDKATEENSGAQGFDDSTNGGRAEGSIQNSDGAGKSGESEGAGSGVGASKSDSGTSGEESDNSENSDSEKEGNQEGGVEAANGIADEIKEKIDDLIYQAAGLEQLKEADDSTDDSTEEDGEDNEVGNEEEKDKDREAKEEDESGE